MVSYAIEVRDYVAGEFAVDVTSGHRVSVADLSVCSDYVVRTAFFVRIFGDVCRSFDGCSKMVLRVFSDGVLSEHWVARKPQVCLHELGFGFDYICKSVLSNVLDVCRVLELVVSPFMKIIVAKDYLYPDFGLAKETVKIEVDSALPIDLRLAKILAKRLMDSVVVFERVYHGKIVEVFDMVLHELDISRGMGKRVSDLAVPADVVAKVAYTLMGYNVRRVYSVPRPLADIIESADHNTKILVCQALIDAVKSLKDKLSE